MVLLFSVCADYSIIIKSKVQELRELRVWPSVGSWEVFAEEETSELGFIKNRCLLGGEEMRRLQAEEGYMQVGSTAETGSGETGAGWEVARRKHQGPAF